MALTTGQLATAADVNIQTVRYYERRGLVRRIRFIKRAQGLGFSLREIQELLALQVRPGSPTDAVKRMTRLKIECVEGKTRRLQRITQALEQLAAVRAARQPAHDFLFPQALED